MKPNTVEGLAKLLTVQRTAHLAMRYAEAQDRLRRYEAEALVYRHTERELLEVRGELMSVRNELAASKEGECTLNASLEGLRSRVKEDLSALRFRIQVLERQGKFFALCLVRALSDLAATRGELITALRNESDWKQECDRIVAALVSGSRGE
jgi:hypothetical protein